MAKNTKFRKKDIPQLKYGVIHSQFGMADGVSIVMKQMETVMTDQMQIPRKNIYYLVGKNKAKAINITQRKVLWDKYPQNRLLLANYTKGLGGEKSETIEQEIRNAQEEIAIFVKKHGIDVLIVHNSAHPVNFISSVALSRYYRDTQKTPKYLCWWHDSHLERSFYLNPAPDVGQYLIEGVPGPHVEYFLFINSLQIKQADTYLKKVDAFSRGFYDHAITNHDVIYNTTDTFIEKFEDLDASSRDDVNQFLNDYKVHDTLEKKGISLKDTVFCLQHTRIVERKRIDFAIRYCYKLLDKMIKEKKAKALYFFISGYDHDGLKKKLNALHRKLAKQYDIETFFISYAYTHKKNTDLVFEEFPRIFAKLGGFSTYFSEIEGFGNNLLEVLASGLVPTVYTYPVFNEDIAKYKLKVIALDKFEVEPKAIEETIQIITNQRKRKIWVNKNIQILKKRFPHKIIARKLTRAIIRKRK